MSLHVAETLCQHLSLLDSEKKKRKEKGTENMGQMRCTRKRSRRGRRRDKGSWKGLKEGIKDTWRGGRSP